MKPLKEWRKTASGPTLQLRRRQASQQRLFDSGTGCPSLSSYIALTHVRQANQTQGL